MLNTFFTGQEDHWGEAILFYSSFSFFFSTMSIRFLHTRKQGKRVRPSVQQLAVSCHTIRSSVGLDVPHGKYWKCKDDQNLARVPREFPN